MSNQATVCGKTVLLPDMNDLQAVFNYVILHLRRQKVRSDGNGECLYRGRHNTSCAVGCLIPDSRYTESLEGDAPTTERLCKCLGLEPDDADAESPIQRLLASLQDLHDTIGECSDTAEFGPDDERAARLIATSFGLSTTATPTDPHDEIRDTYLKQVIDARKARATHQCAVCEAYWIDNSVFGDGDTWSLASETCDQCCDNDDMSRPNIVKTPWFDRLTR